MARRKYDVHPSVSYARSIIDNLPEKTGKSLDQWIRLLKVCPGKTIVPLYRNHVFAEIKPSTRSRIDFGLALKSSNKKPPASLKDTGGLARGDRITHRFAITSSEEADAAVVRNWLRIAYDLDA